MTFTCRNGRFTYRINALVAGLTIFLAAFQRIFAKFSSLLEYLHPLPKSRKRPDAAASGLLIFTLQMEQAYRCASRNDAESLPQFVLKLHRRHMGWMP